jgi:hypothetical protein
MGLFEVGGAVIVVMRALFADDERERERVVLSDPSAVTDVPTFDLPDNAPSWVDDVVLASLQYLTGVSENVEWPQT